MAQSKGKRKIEISTAIGKSSYYGNVKAVFEMNDRYELLDVMNGSKCAYDFLKRYILLPENTLYTEEFHVLYTSRGNRLIAHSQISSGGISGTVADIRHILSLGLIFAATGMIMAHNHPSGNMRPSQQDIELTRKVKEAGKLMDITLLDHVIIAGDLNSYYSFADEGQL